jgi:hypothetical protein
VDDGAVEAALNRDELSVVEAVFVFEAPLPRLPLISSNMFSSLRIGEVFGLPIVVLTDFAPPSKDLLVPSGRSKTLNDGSATGASWRSSRAFAVDFRRPKPLGNLGI